jgi:hypothetical protein
VFIRRVWRTAVRALRLYCKRAFSQIRALGTRAN